MVDVYLASSLDNERRELIRQALRCCGYSIHVGDEGREPTLDISLTSRTQREHYADTKEMEQTRLCVLVLPAGPSAHMAAGYCVGNYKPLLILLPAEPYELWVYCLATWTGTDVADLVKVALDVVPPSGILHPDRVDERGKEAP